MRIAVKQAVLLPILLLLSVSVTLGQGDKPPEGSTQFLDRVVLTIDPQQVVGVPLRGTAEVRLFDENNELVPDYNLVDSPLVLIPGTGTLIPDTITDQGLFSNGLIDLLAADVLYRGQTGSIQVVAQLADVASTGVIVSFNGYDLLSTTFTDGSPINQIYAGLESSMLVTVRNNGSLVPASDPYVLTYFTSGGGSVKSFFNGGSNGALDTLSILLPEVFEQRSEDTLLVSLVSSYEIDSVLYTTADTVLIPVTILPPPSVAIVQGSVGPDSLYTGIDFLLDFNVIAGGLGDPIDSTPVTIRLVKESSGPQAALLYSGLAPFTQDSNDSLFYRDLAVSGSLISIDTGWYRVEYDYALYAGSQSFIFNNIVVDSLLLLAPPTIEYISGSLSPLSAIGGAEVGFEFDVLLDGTQPVQLLETRTNFSLSDGEYSTTVSLRAPDNTLNPGVTTVSADPVLLPLELAPGTLQAEAVVTVRQAGIGNAVRLETDFEGQSIDVLTPIAIQLVSAYASGIPNAPFVNTGQAFQINARLANLAQRTATDIDVVLHSNGQSIIADTLIRLDSIQPFSSRTVFFDVVASPESNSSETFEVNVSTTSAEVVEPLDDIELMTVQTPAQLTLGCSLAGLENGYAGVGDRFGFVVFFDNSGEAQTSSCQYQLTTHGVYVGIPDPFIGEFTADTTLSFIFTAPNVDTVLTIDFELLSAPLDVNTGLPAALANTSCTASVLVTSLQPDLVLGGEVPGGNLVVAGGLSDLLNLSFVNRGVSARSNIQIEQVRIRFAGASGEPARVRSILEIASAGLFENDEVISTATAGNDVLLLNLASFIIEPGTERNLHLRSRVKADSPKDFKIVYNRNDVEAEYLDGPLAGQVVGVATPDGDTTVVSEPVSLVTAGVESFSVRNNPFNPVDAPAEFSYLLSESGTVEFRILTLTGELVYSRILSAGEAGTEPGLAQTLLWDGRNGEGDIVLNGVYIAILETPGTGGQKLMKVAVVK